MSLNVGWLEGLQRGGEPIYLAVVRALESAIQDGELQPGDRLPPQRQVAEHLGVDLTTITRAYTAARAKGLIEGTVGRGTFVRARTADDEAGLVDLSMNLPPPPEGVGLAAMLKETTAGVLDRTDAATLMAYHPGAGALGQKAAGAAWLAPVLGEISPQRVLVCPGAQAGLMAALSVLVGARGTLLVEPLSYPGMKAAAAILGIRLLPCPVDEQGLIPAELDRIAGETAAMAVYVIPTLQNPTATTMSTERRRDIAQVARRRDLWVIEDDPYSRLLDAPPPAITRWVPERGVYLGTLSKCLSPGLRTAYLVCPPGPGGERIAEALRATALMPAPLMTAVVTTWIREGVAETLLAGVRREALVRRAAAARILPAARGPADSIHVWLDLPAAWAPDHLRRAAQEQGLSLVTAQAFATGPEAPNGMRISLGGPGKLAVLIPALDKIAGLLAQGPQSNRMVV